MRIHDDPTSPQPEHQVIHRHAHAAPLPFALVRRFTSILAVAGCQYVAGITGDLVLEGNGGHGGAGGQTSSSTSSGVVCVPNTQQACYNGATGTEGKGNCKAGAQTCDAQGLGYGPCTGEVVPALEDCDKLGDESCDGFACGDPAWASNAYGRLWPLWHLWPISTTEQKHLCS